MTDMEWTAIAVQLQRRFQNLADGILQKHNKPRVSVRVYHDPADNTTGYTTGSVIVLNLGNEVIQHFATDEAKIVAAHGMVFHEIAHCVYLDFDSSRIAQKTMQSGWFWPETPTYDGIESIVDDMSDAAVCHVLSQIAGNIENCLDDANNEMRICESEGRLVNQAIYTTATALHAETGSYQEMIRKAWPPIARLLSLILQQARYGSIVLENDQEPVNDPLWRKFQTIIPFIEEGKLACDAKTQYRAINQLLCRVWEIIKELVQNQENQCGSSGEGQDGESNAPSGNQGENQSGDQAESQNGNQTDSQNGNQSGDQSGNQTGGQSGNGELRAQDIQNILDALQDARNSVNSQQAPQNRTGKGEPGNALQTGGIHQTIIDPSLGQSILNNLRKEIAREATAEENTRKEHTATIDLIQDNVPANHARIQLHVIRNNLIPDNAEQVYKDYYRNTKAVSRNLQRQIRNALMEASDDAPIKAVAGPRLKAENAWRLDGKMFEKEKFPEDIPETVIGILIDQSGSMLSDTSEGETRINLARRCAIMLDDFSEGLRIPVMIAGHHTVGDGTALHVYVPWKSTKRDRLSLIGMQPAGCNRDGLALGTMVNILAKRPEEIKLLFIISDGRPNDTGYRGDVAKADLQSICKQATNQGVEIVACGIGDDKDVLKDIYGDRFLNISDLQNLPKLLVRVVQKRIVAKL